MTAISWIPMALLMSLTLVLAGCDSDQANTSATPVAGGGQNESSPTNSGSTAAAVPPASQKTANPSELSSAHAVRLAPTAVMDAAGFGQPVVAATLFAPHGWKTNGGIAWGQQHACVNGYAFAWSAESPDELRGMAILPQQRWEWNANRKPLKLGCPISQIDSVQGYLEAILPEILPQARVLTFRPRPDVERELSGLTEEKDTGFQYSVSKVSAAEALVEFEKQGVVMRGVVSAAVQFNYLRTGGGQYGIVTENYVGYALPAYAAYAPADEFNPAFYEALRRSFLTNPQWESLIAQHNQTMGRIERKGVMDRARIHNQTMKEISEMRQNAWDAQQKSSDVRAREFIEVIRDVETYSDEWAPGGQVELSSFYEHAWRLDDGSYVLTDDPSFQPGVALGIDGQVLNRTE